jgi:peptidyl-prolyl cis-trans isomerase A (cyclophilin A)
MEKMMRGSRVLVVAAIAIQVANAGCRSQKQPPAEEQTPASATPPAGSTSSASNAKPAEPAAVPHDAPPSDSDTVDGYRVIHARTKSGDNAAIQVKTPPGWDIVVPPDKPDPQAGKFTLEQATQGLPKQGTLAAHIKTSLGSFYCDLFADKAPNTVANFVGLARGLREFWDGEKLAWTGRPYYDGTPFHRVIPGFMIQGGDHTGTGRGGIGYMIPDEVSPDLHHDRPGQLCMANKGKNTNEAQFFITEGAAPHLEGSYTIFGQCEPATLVQRIARVPQSGPPDNRPLTPVLIEHVEIKRVPGGIAKWMPESAKLAPMPGIPAPGRAVQIPLAPPASQSQPAH